MTDKKQIKEMEKIINDNAYSASSLQVALKLYNAGYRKLSKETQEMVSNALVYSKRLKIEKSAEKVRKETAKEILQSLYDRCYERAKANGGKACDVIPIDILQFAAQYGVEIEE